MSYRSRKIIIENETIHNLIRKLSEGSFLVPTFQRPYVWEPENIRALWHSIYNGYPIGSILYWKTRMCLNVHRKIGGFYYPGAGEEGSAYRAYILDGQQRITSLNASFHGGIGKVRERHGFDFTLYFNLKNASFFFENEYYKHRWDVDAALLIRVKDAPDLPMDYCGRLPGNSPDIEGNLKQLQYIFTDYHIPLLRLEGFDVSSVCEIFERINQNGRRLDNLDILIARSFENYDTVVEEDFPVKS